MGVRCRVRESMRAHMRCQAPGRFRRGPATGGDGERGPGRGGGGSDSPRPRRTCRHLVSNGAVEMETKTQSTSETPLESRSKASPRACIALRARSRQARQALPKSLAAGHDAQKRAKEQERASQWGGRHDSSCGFYCVDSDQGEDRTRSYAGSVTTRPRPPRNPFHYRSYLTSTFHPPQGLHSGCSHNPAPGTRARLCRIAVFSRRTNVRYHFITGQSNRRASAVLSRDKTATVSTQSFTTLPPSIARRWRSCEANPRVPRS